jgi:Cof subfamily protein (haloacid dehalogenase superfamily)
MNEKIFFCDIDGTLVKDDMVIPKEVVAEAKRFMEEGGTLCLCTGRSPISVSKIAKELEVNGPSILYTGSAIYDFIQGEYVWYCTFKPNIKEKIKKLLSNYPSTSIQVYTKDSIYLLQENDLLLSRGVKEEIPKNIAFLSDIDDYNEVIKVVLTNEDKEVLRHCYNTLFNDEGYKFEFSSRHFVEVVSDQAGKSKSAKRVIEALGYKNPIIFAAGDGMTDIPILEMADVSFAPVDAIEEVTKSALIIVESCLVGGMSKAFRIATEM